MVVYSIEVSLLVNLNIWKFWTLFLSVVMHQFGVIQPVDFLSSACLFNTAEDLGYLS